MADERQGAPLASNPFLTLLEVLGEGCAAPTAQFERALPPPPHTRPHAAHTVSRHRRNFGKVFKALHHRKNRVVAVKIVALDDEVSEVRSPRLCPCL